MDNACRVAYSLQYDSEAKLVATYQDLEQKLILRWVDTEDVLATQRAIIEVTPESATMELPRGRRGEPGDKGDPGAQMWLRGLITDNSELPTNLREVDQGAAWANTVTRSLWVWNGRNYIEIPNFIGIKGDAGETPRFQIGSVKPGLEAEVSVNHAASTDTLVVLDFTLPQGPQGDPGDKGDPGEAAALSESPDVDVSQPPEDGEALVWNGAKWAPRTVLAPIGPWVLAANDFTSFSQGTSGSGSVSEHLIASITVPPMPFDWHPVVLGGNLQVESSLSVQLDVEVRVGNAQRGDLVGYGTGRKNQSFTDLMVITPATESRVTPASPTGMVEANSATTIYVVLKKVQGSTGRWGFQRTNASLAFMAMPANPEYGG